MKRAAFAALLAAATITAAASAQNTEPAAATKIVTGVELKRLDLQLDGQPLPEVIEYLSETTGRNIVLLMPRTIEPNSIIVPKMKLKHVSLEQVLDLITQLPGVEMSYEISGDGESVIYQVRVERAEFVDQAINPEAMPPEAVVVPGHPFNAPASEPYLSVISLERVFLGANPQQRIPKQEDRKDFLAFRTNQALTLIDQAFAMNAQGAAKPEIKLHSETNTLLVKATPMQLQTINQVLTALETHAPSKEERDFERQRQELIRDFEAQRRNDQIAMERMMRMNEEQLARTQASRDELEKRLQGMIEHVEQLKAQLKAAQGNTQPQ